MIEKYNIFCYTSSLDFYWCAIHTPKTEDREEGCVFICSKKKLFFHHKYISKYTTNKLTTLINLSTFIQNRDIFYSKSQIKEKEQEIEFKDLAEWLRKEKIL